MKQYGIITEQGDLGLGFDVLDHKDQKVINESVEQEKKKDQEKKKYYGNSIRH